MTIKEIKAGDLVLARYIPAEFVWKDGLNFFSLNEEYIQVGAWGYDNGKELLAHIHNEISREILITQEVLYIQRGSIKATIYDTNQNSIAEIVAKEGDVLILLHGGHGYNILEDGTRVLEIKNGPYVGADLDRRRI